jgi:hypothetical protein
MFGRQECLDASQQAKISNPASATSDTGVPGLAEFKVAFAKLLDTVAKVTPNVVVVSPPGFHPSPVGMDEATSRLMYKRAFAYRNAQEEMADARSLVFVDATRPWSIDGPPRTRDGVNLTDAGMMDVLSSFHHGFALPGNMQTVFANGHVTRIVPTLQSKNRLWHDYWRPTNWAFLHGDRTQQPSSRDHVNPQIRFFPAEQEKYLPLIKEAEEKVYKLVEEATKKLP